MFTYTNTVLTWILSKCVCVLKIQHKDKPMTSIPHVGQTHDICGWIKLVKWDRNHPQQMVKGKIKEVVSLRKYLIKGQFFCLSHCNFPIIDKDVSFTITCTYGVFIFDLHVFAVSFLTSTIVIFILLINLCSKNIYASQTYQDFHKIV